MVDTLYQGMQSLAGKLAHGHGQGSTQPARIEEANLQQPHLAAVLPEPAPASGCGPQLLAAGMCFHRAAPCRNGHSQRLPPSEFERVPAHAPPHNAAPAGIRAASAYGDELAEQQDALFDIDDSLPDKPDLHSVDTTTEQSHLEDLKFPG